MPRFFKALTGKGYPFPATGIEGIDPRPPYIRLRAFYEFSPVHEAGDILRCLYFTKDLYYSIGTDVRGLTMLIGKIYG